MLRDVLVKSQSFLYLTKVFVSVNFFEALGGRELNNKASFPNHLGKEFCGCKQDCDSHPFSPTRSFCSTTRIPPKRTEVWLPFLSPLSSRSGSIFSSSNWRIAIGPCCFVRAESRQGVNSRVCLRSRVKEVPWQTLVKGIPAAVGQHLCGGNAASWPSWSLARAASARSCLWFTSCLAFSSHSLTPLKKVQQKGELRWFSEVWQGNAWKFCYLFPFLRTLGGLEV